MYLRVEGSREERAEKGALAVERVAELLAGDCPECAEQLQLLQKALPRKEPELKYRALRTLAARTKKAYDETIKEMLNEIVGVLDRDIEKGGTPVGGITPGGYRKVAEGRYVKEGPQLIHGPIQKGIQKRGGKVAEHKQDPNMVVLKLPKSEGAFFAKLKQGAHLEHEIISGGKYLLMFLEKGLLNHLEAKAQAGIEEKKKPQPKKPKKGKKAPTKAGKAPSAAPMVAQAPSHDGAVQHPTPDWKPPASVEDAQAWCAHHDIQAEFPDLPTARAVTQALSEQHPATLKHVRFIGTPAQLRKWAKANPGIVKKAKGGKHKQDLTSQDVLSGTAVAVAHPIGKKPYDTSVIVVKPSWWGEGRANMPSKADSFSLSNNTLDVVRHECGHVEAFLMSHMTNEQGKNVWQGVWKSHIVPRLKGAPKGSAVHAAFAKEVSTYATTNPHEFWAEVSVLRRNDLRPIPEWVQKAIDEMGIDKGDWHQMGAPA